MAERFKANDLKTNKPANPPHLLDGMTVTDYDGVSCKLTGRL
jgi:hypothetical protein